MADLNLGELIIKDGAVSYLVDNFLSEKPNEALVKDPDWVDPSDGTSAPMVKEYSDKQWFLRCIKEFVATTCRKGKHKRDRKAAVIENDIFM